MQNWQEEFAIRFARHADELKWLYMELYHNADKVDVWELFGIDLGCIVTKIFTFRFVQSSVGSVSVFIDLAPAYRDKKIAGIFESSTEPANASEHVQIFDLCH